MARSGEATKEKILDSAEALVFEHGFAASSLDNDTCEAGLWGPSFTTTMLPSAGSMLSNWAGRTAINPMTAFSMSY